MMHGTTNIKFMTFCVTALLFHILQVWVYSKRIWAE